MAMPEIGSGVPKMNQGGDRGNLGQIDTRLDYIDGVLIETADMQARLTAVDNELKPLGKSPVHHDRHLGIMRDMVAMALDRMSDPNDPFDYTDYDETYLTIQACVDNPEFNWTTGADVTHTDGLEEHHQSLAS